MSVPPPDVSADAAVLDDVLPHGAGCSCGHHATALPAQGGWLAMLEQWFGFGAACAEDAARRQAAALDALQLQGPLLLNDMHRWLAFIEQDLEEGYPGWCAKAQELGGLAAAAHVHGVERLAAACAKAERATGGDIAVLETQLARLRAAMPV